MRFYALVYWRLFNVIPAQLKLMYLKVMDSMVIQPSREELEYFERDLGDLWANIAVSYTHLTLPTIHVECRSRWSPYH